MKLRIDLNEPQIIQKVTSDRFGKLVSSTWKKLIDPYTPKDTGSLEKNVTELPFALHYKQWYARYMYEGIVYVDPKYKVGAFYNPEYGFWSRFGVKKIPSDRKFNYQKNNDFSTDHWDIKAAEAGQLNKLYRTINNALQSGRY